MNTVKEAIESGYHQLPTGDTNVSKDSWEAALQAVGAVISACEEIMSGKFASTYKGLEAIHNFSANEEANGDIQHNRLCGLKLK